MEAGELSNEARLLDEVVDALRDSPPASFFVLLDSEDVVSQPHLLHQQQLLRLEGSLRAFQRFGITEHHVLADGINVVLDIVQHIGVEEEFVLGIRIRHFSPAARPPLS